MTGGVVFFNPESDTHHVESVLGIIMKYSVENNISIDFDNEYYYVDTFHCANEKNCMAYSFHVMTLPEIMKSLPIENKDEVVNRCNSHFNSDDEEKLRFIDNKRLELIKSKEYFIRPDECISQVCYDVTVKNAVTRNATINVFFRKRSKFLFAQIGAAASVRAARRFLECGRRFRKNDAF